MLELQDRLVYVLGYRGEPRDRICRVVDVRDTFAKPLLQKQFRRYQITRSQYLITVHDLKENIFRSYYDRYVEIVPLNTVQILLHRLTQWWKDN